jgi:hypothetical protein
MIRIPNDVRLLVGQLRMVLTALQEAMGSYPLPTAYSVEYSGAWNQSPTNH